MHDFYTATQPDSDAGLLGAPIYTAELELLTSILELGLVTHCLGPALSFPPRESAAYLLIQPTFMRHYLSKHFNHVI